MLLNTFYVEDFNFKVIETKQSVIIIFRMVH